MIKRSILLNLCLMIAAVAMHAADWAALDINKMFTVSFPGPVRMAELSDLRNYVYVTDSCSYLVQVKTIKKGDVINDTTALAGFYNGVVKGILRGDKASLIGSKPVSIAGMRGQEFEYVKGNEHQQPVSVCSRTLVLNGCLIVYSFSAPYSRFAAQKDGQDRFFASFKLDESLPVSQLMDTGGVAPAHAVATNGTVSTHAQTAIHTELVKTNTLYFIVSFAVSILLLISILYVSARFWKSKEKA